LNNFNKNLDQSIRNAKNTPISNKRKKYILVRLWRYLYQFKWLLLVAAGLTVASNLFALIGPMLSGYAIDAIDLGTGNVAFDRVFYYAGWMMIFYLLSSIMSYILSVIMIKLSRNVVSQMRRDVFNKLSELPVSFFDKYQAGEVISVISYDIDVINASLSTDLLQICTSIITVAGSLIMMIVLSPPLVLIFVVTIPISILFTRYMSKKVRPLFKKRSAKLGELNGYIEEVTSGHKTTKAYNQEEVMIGRFDGRNKEAVDAYFKADYYGSMTGPSVNFINNLSIAFISMFGAILFLYGRMSLGDISSFIQYSRKFSGPINELANIIAELQSAFAAAERVFRLIDEEQEPADDIDAIMLDDVKGNVRIENVKFGYEPEKIILHNLSLNADSGNVIAIVGPTGAGKTTIINLLMRFYDVNSGVIKIDDHDIKMVTRKSLRLSYTMVLQDTWLFYGTILENIAYGKENVTEDEIKSAAKAAKIHNYIMQLPEGYNTILSDNGINISKGQKQLLTIARAMLLDSKMLILDEATSNVDTQTEQQIQEAMLKLMKDRTCFVIAHRLSTIQNADLILVVNKGNIVEQGTHNELLNKKGFYHDLYNSQFEEY